jgi:hypothetical protein
MTRTLLFYGNCQAAALCVIFAADPVISGVYRVVHVPSFDDRIPNAERVGLEEIGAAAIFLDQHDRTPFPHLELLPPDCLRITFPSVDFNLLWPLDCINVFNDAPTTEFPWGHFPYGDRVVVESVKRGESADEVIGHYLESARGLLPNLDRFATLEYARLRARDEKCEVKFADFVIENFRDTNLFWCVNHPTLPALTELCHRLVAAVNERSMVPFKASIAETVAKLDPEGPLGFLHVPIHPAVVEHFGLRWYPRDEGQYYGIRGSRLTYGEYLKKMLDVAVSVRDLVGVGPPA